MLRGFRRTIVAVTHHSRNCEQRFFVVSSRRSVASWDVARGARACVRVYLAVAGQR